MRLDAAIGHSAARACAVAPGTVAAAAAAVTRGRRRRQPSPFENPRLPARPLTYLWALPTTAVGLLALLLASMVGRVRYQVVAGVLEIYGGLITWFLTACTPLEHGASAMTLGHVVLGRDERLLDLTRDHERVHVRQAERWGPMFIPAYLLASVLVALRGGRPYQDNPFEREAFGRAGRGRLCWHVFVPDAETVSDRLQTEVCQERRPHPPGLS